MGNQESLIKKLKTGSQPLPLESVRQILSDELSKPPVEMDTELVDLCVEVIEKAETEEKGKRLIQLLKSDSGMLPFESVCQIMNDELSKPVQEMNTTLIDLCAEVIKKAEAEGKGRKLIGQLKADGEKLPFDCVRQTMEDELSKPVEEMNTALIDLCANAIQKTENEEKGKRLLRLLKAESVPLPCEIVEQILDDELLKPESEMDTELIDLCAEALGGEVPEPTTEKKTGSSKLLILVAIAAALLVALLPSFASRIRIKASNEIVSVDKSGHYVIDLCRAETKAESCSDKDNALVKALCDAGIEHPVLPDELLDDDISFTVEKKRYGKEGYVVARIFDSNGKSKGIISVKSKIKMTSSPKEINVLSGTYGNVKQSKLHGLDVFSFTGNNCVVLYYVDFETEYTITLLSKDT